MFEAAGECHPERHHEIHIHIHIHMDTDLTRRTQTLERPA
jgi:hypothetical protein